MTATATTTITKDLCKTLNEELATAIAAIAAKHGLTAKVSGGKFGASSFTPRVEFLVAGQTVDGASKKEEDDFRAFSKVYGLQPEMLGKTFRSGKETFRVLGALPSRSKNCILILRTSDNARRICPPELLLRGTFLPA